MASTTSLSADDPQHSVLEGGVFYTEDPVIGKRVDDIVSKGFLFKTEEGLDFCKLCTLDDKRVRHVLESTFEWSALGLYKVFGPNPNHTFSFANRIETQVKAQIIIIQLWSTGSRMVFYSGSHLQSLDATPAPIGLLEILPARLEQAGIKSIEVEMKDGGLAIIDGRLGFTILQGKVITLGFAALEELNEWSKMPLPNTQNLKRKVAEMEGAKIGVNFTFVD